MQCVTGWGKPTALLSNFQMDQHSLQPPTWPWGSAQNHSGFWTFIKCWCNCTTVTLGSIAPKYQDSQADWLSLEPFTSTTCLNRLICKYQQIASRSSRLLEDQLTAIEAQIPSFLGPYGESHCSIFLNIFGHSCSLFLTLPDSMDASHFTESSVLLSCFFKQPNTGCSQSQVNGTDSTVIVIQIKPIYNNNNNLVVFYAMILLKLNNHDRNYSIVFGKTPNYILT